LLTPKQKRSLNISIDKDRVIDFYQSVKEWFKDHLSKENIKTFYQKEKQLLKEARYYKTIKTVPEAVNKRELNPEILIKKSEELLEKTIIDQKAYK
jgi:hypothetical protein